MFFGNAFFVALTCSFVRQTITDCMDDRKALSAMRLFADLTYIHLFVRARDMGCYAFGRSVGTVSDENPIWAHISSIFSVLIEVKRQVRSVR